MEMTRLTKSPWSTCYDLLQALKSYYFLSHHVLFKASGIEYSTDSSCIWLWLLRSSDLFNSRWDGIFDGNFMTCKLLIWQCLIIFQDKIWQFYPCFIKLKNHFSLAERTLFQIAQVPFIIPKAEPPPFFGMDVVLMQFWKLNKCRQSSLLSKLEVSSHFSTLK